MTGFTPPPDSNAAGAPIDPHRIDQHRLEANWRAIQIELDAPRQSLPERLLRSVGVPADVTRLIVATPALRRSWYLAVAAAVVIALTVADSETPRQSVALFLTLAPLVGVAGVAMAYGPNADPAHELQLVAPMPGLRIVAIRTLVVMVIASVAIVGGAALSPVTRPFALLWLLPSIAVAACALALMSTMSPRRAATVAAVGWCSIVLASQVGSDPLVVFTSAGQVVAVAVAAGAIAVTIRRRDAFDRLMEAT
ncbi:MAG: zf-HC2 domain-containing protein [Ilumatobacter sp.]|jgi:hypothetical protein|uniref:zf-HC2 domain-containing protein n=1 Tax=Ilumatobacter sp. TaxID=1967498 RepID=UPI00391928DC